MHWNRLFQNNTTPPLQVNKIVKKVQDEAPRPVNVNAFHAVKQVANVKTFILDQMLDAFLVNS